MTGLICCTLNCNLACSYCYEGNGKNFCQPNTKTINEKFSGAKDKIIQFIDELYSYNGEAKTKIIFHGGEPTLINYQLIEEIIEDQEAKNHNIAWSMQSNGTLITDQYAKMLASTHTTIGISIDGLKEQHDKYRVFKNGGPTFEVIVRNIEKLQNNNVRCGTLITITNNNIDHLLEIYDFFASRNLSFNFNALFPDTNDTDIELNTNKYAEKICELFDYWMNDNTTKIIINPFIQIIEAFLNKEHRVPACHWAKNCSRDFCAIDTNGDLYPCEHWIGNKDFCFGNIANGLKTEITKCNYFIDRERILKREDCCNCEIWEMCYGGCPWNGYTLFDNPNRKDASICIGRKMIIEHIKKFLINNDKISI